MAAIASVTSLNGPKIKAVFDKTQTTKALREVLANRKRNTPFLDVKRTYMEMMRNGVAIEYTDIVAACKELEDLGAGTYIKGRGINGDVFNWKYAVKHVVEIARTGKVDHIPAMIEKHKQEVSKKSAENRIKKLKSIAGGSKKVVSLRSRGNSFGPKVVQVDAKTIEVYIRPELAVQFQVPHDLTRSEAKQLCISITNAVKG